uniref:Small ribosomal subunit protein mS31 n=1 Tax=Crassostrea virginica TaxID=6565 RepID=A0A8B8AS34_CRAVI|nr:uncharacterized protein LOC111104044 isoform X3 [Crassostrea virginica]
MATSILRRSCYQRLQKFYVILNSSQNASFLRRDFMTPVCASSRFYSNTPSDNSGSVTGNKNENDSKKTVLLPEKSAQYLSDRINEIAEKTGTSLKLEDEKGTEGKIPLSITATSPKDILKAVTEINEVLQKNLVEARLGQPLQERLEELIYLPRHKAEFLFADNSSALLDLQNETGTQIKVLSDSEDEQVLLMLTATEQEAVDEVLIKIQEYAAKQKMHEEKLTVNHPATFSLLKELPNLRKQTGAKIHFQKQEEGGVFTFSGRNPAIVEKAKSKILEHLDSFKDRKFTFKTQGRKPWGVLIGKKGSNLKQLTNKIKEVDPSLNMKMESSKFDNNFDVVTLTATQAIDDEKFEAAANLISQEMAKIDQACEDETEEKKAVLLGEEEEVKVNQTCFFRVVKSLPHVEKETGTRITFKKSSGCIIIQGKNQTDIEKAKAKLQELERKNNVWTFNVEKNPKNFFGMLIGRSSANYQLLLEKIQLLDPSLRLAYSSANKQVYLWGAQDMDHAKFMEAESIVSKRIEEIESRLETVEGDEKWGEESVLKTFSFQNTSLLPRLFAILIGSGGETINKLVESLKKLDPAFRLDAYSERNSIQLKGSKDLDPAKIEEAETIVLEKLAEIENFAGKNKSKAILDDKSKMKSFNFETPDEAVIGRLIGAKGERVRTLREMLRSIDRSFELAIDKNEKITRLYASKDIDDDTFEKGKAVMAKEIARVEEQASRMSQMRDSNMREIKIDMDLSEVPQFIGRLGSNIQRVETRLSAIDKLYKLETKLNAVILTAREEYFDAMLAVIEEEVEKIRLAENTFISPVQRPVSEQMASEASHIESFISDKKEHIPSELLYKRDFLMTLRMANGLSDPVDSVMEKIKTQAKKQGKKVEFSMLHRQLRVSCDSENDLDAFCKEIKKAFSRNSQRFTEAINITDSIWVSLLDGKMEDIEYEYGVKLYTYGWKMMDQDILEIEYVNVEDFDAARKAINDLHNPYLKSREITMHRSEVYYLLEDMGQPLRELMAETKTTIRTISKADGQKSVLVFGNDEKDIDAAIEKVRAISTNKKDLVKLVPKAKIRKPAERKRFNDERQELVYLVREALDKREITDTQEIDIPEDFSFSKVKPLNIWTKEDLKKPEREDPTDNLWYQLDKQGKEIHKLNVPTYNGFDDMIRLTKEGKMWHYPIDNEQGMEEEQAVSFADHVFFDDLLEDFPSSGPIRTFMEQVTVGLSQNPNLSVEEKREHIEWYKNYFQQKAEALKDTLGENVELKTLFSSETSKQTET